MRVLGLIPARGGSKGVPRKNIRMVGGRPLLWYTAKAAQAATRLTRVILNTDDEEIAEVGRACGLEVPFMRSAALGKRRHLDARSYPGHAEPSRGWSRSLRRRLLAATNQSPS